MDEYDVRDFSSFPGGCSGVHAPDRFGSVLARFPVVDELSHGQMLFMFD